MRKLLIIAGLSGLIFGILTISTAKDELKNTPIFALAITCKIP